jgi:tetratricopeptide (TPR) repeat protein
MTLLLLAALALAQAGLQPASSPLDEKTPEQDRLSLCLQKARSDPAGAMVMASGWLAEEQGAGRAFPQQCLGFAYISLQRWDAAEEAFLGAHDALLENEQAGRARLAAMAGNAALAEPDYTSALHDLELAQADARASGNAELGGEIATDRARALVGLDRLADAALALADARRDAPQTQSVWLLSATLARRMEEFEKAQGFIDTALALNPDDQAVVLEAGLIAMLAGHDNAARQYWHKVIALDPKADEAKSAFYYLTQLNEMEEKK